MLHITCRCLYNIASQKKGHRLSLTITNSGDQTMMRSRNIFLVGMPGVGKSTIGKQLADQLKLRFIDSDHEIESRCGADISWIFDIEGEEGFRERERKVIHELTEKSGIVLATGGGSILTPANRDRLSARGTVVYLKAPLEQHVERTLRDRKRPLLQTEDKAKTLEAMQKEREPLYQEIADIVVNASDSTVRSVVNEIIKRIEEDDL